MSVSLRLPWPPSVNHYWLRNRSGGLRISAKGDAFRLHVLMIVKHAKAAKLAGKLAIEILAFPPDNRRRDIDNLLKATLDALQHAGLYEDDNQINSLEIIRCAVIRDGVLEVKVGALA